MTVSDAIRATQGRLGLDPILYDPDHQQVCLDAVRQAQTEILRLIQPSLQRRTLILQEGERHYTIPRDVLFISEIYLDEQRLDRVPIGSLEVEDS